jgi:hypothetical protein
MKNYQKILIPCAAAFVLSLSAFVSAEESSFLHATKVKSVAQFDASLVEGETVAESKVHVSTKSDKFAVETVDDFKTVEAKVATSRMSPTDLNMESIVASYK